MKVSLKINSCNHAPFILLWKFLEELMHWYLSYYLFLFSFVYEVEDFFFNNQLPINIVSFVNFSVKYSAALWCGSHSDHMITVLVIITSMMWLLLICDLVFAYFPVILILQCLNFCLLNYPGSSWHGGYVMLL